MNKDSFYCENGREWYGIFREIPLNGANNIEGSVPPPSYTVNEEDDDLPSAHKIYMDSMNEYEAAKALVPTWEFWKNMLKFSVKIRRLIEGWREEKMLKDQAAARRMLWEMAQKGNVSAQRILYESKKEEAQQRQAQARAAMEDRHQQEMAEKVLGRLKVVK